MGLANRKYCKNCGNLASGKYCQDCGQRTTVHRVTFRETFEDFIESVFTVNAPFFLTLKGLALNPGKLFADFLSGKRKTYYKPVAFFVLTTIVYLLIRSIIDFDPFQDSSVIAVDENQGTQLITLARNYMLLNINKLLFILVFTLAMFLKLFFYKIHSLSEFLVVSFYLTGVYTIFTTLNMFYIEYIDSKFQAWGILFMGAYFVFAMVSFINKKRIWVVLKSIPVFFLAYVFYMVLAFVFSYVIVSFKN
ncbi:MAG: DUF3667 domain-containing protein [Maribacter sp.]|uniref:DUF3667 domain-containing protein n=1 Tax=Maribacter sp. TaxID=1897614 RepID=UPI003C7101FE